MSKTVELGWFNGRAFTLTGVDTGSEGDASTISFELNGTIYTAKEDPDDGYRSALDEIRVDSVVSALKNKFPPCRVDAAMSPKPDANVIQFRSRENGKIVLEIGTDHEDDYYPSFVGFFDPKAMPINADTSKSVAERLEEASMSNPNWASW